MRINRDITLPTDIFLPASPKMISLQDNFFLVYQNLSTCEHYFFCFSQTAA